MKNITWKRHYNKGAPRDVTMSTLVGLVDMIEKPKDVHKINTKLFSISFPQLRCLQELALESTNFDYSSAEYRVIPLTFQHSYDQHQSLIKFQFTLEIKSHQLCHINTLALLPANYLTLHQSFQI